MSLSAGVVTAVVVAVASSVWLARGFMLSDEIQRSLAVRSVTTPFALAAAKELGAQPDLVALFVVITGVFGMALGGNAVLTSCYPGGDGERSRVRRGFPWCRERRARMSWASRRAWWPAW